MSPTHTGGRERSGLTLAVYLTQRWLPSKQLTLRASTWDADGRNLDLHVVPRLGRVPLRHLRPDHLDRLYVDLLDDAVRRVSPPATWSTEADGRIRMDNV